MIISDVLDFQSVSEAMKDIDAVVHLAANNRLDQPWETASSVGITGTYNVFEAARIAGVNKVIYASSIAVLGNGKIVNKKKVPPHAAYHPTTFYGIAKSTGELLAQYYSETYGMSIICIRIGSFYVHPPDPQTLQDEILHSWCSPSDLANLIERCLETNGLDFQIFYGVSNNKRNRWDIQNSRRLVGYEPKSNAEDLINPKRSYALLKLWLEENSLLIHAAIQESPEAADSWEQWLNTVDFDHVEMDKHTFSLLPLVYHNLMRQKYDHPLMPRLKGIYRRTWLENQVSLIKIIPFLHQFYENEIPVIVLDDLTSMLSLYDGQGIHQIYALDILIRKDDIPRILNQLNTNKIWSKVSAGGRYLKVETPLEFWSPFELPITVAWRLYPYIKTQGQADAVWEHAEKTQLGNSPVYTLGYNYQFLRLCQRVASSNPEVAFFSLIDIAWMLSKQADRMDIKRLKEIIADYHLVFPVIESLQMINECLNISFARELLDECRDLPVSAIDRLEHRWINLYRPFPDLTARICRRLLLYRRSPKISGIFGFFRYFQFAWGGEKLRTLPVLIFHHLSPSKNWKGE